MQQNLIDANLLIWFHLGWCLPNNSQALQMLLPVCSWCRKDAPQREQTWHLIKMSLTWCWSSNQAEGVHRRDRPCAAAARGFIFFSTSAITRQHNTPFSAHTRRLPEGLIVALSFLSSLEDHVWTSKWFHIRRQLRLAFQDVQSRCSRGFSVKLQEK